MVALLIEKGAKLEEEDRLHKSELVYAAGMGHDKVVEQLVNAGALVDAAYIDGLTPLMWAAGQGHTDTVRFLVSKGANKSLKDERGLTALDMAKEAGHARIVDALQ
jgi:ankyrin repeat protein